MSIISAIKQKKLVRIRSKIRIKKNTLQWPHPSNANTSKLLYNMVSWKLSVFYTKLKKKIID